ncbi:GIY-YIG nuclease family protein [Nocardia sp. NPDC058480]|uniref:GIY-YIG nuclease family protein n=1 Tax=Nocardia sp. NPDC058480 TaxID=3346522 RepID=UPI00364D84DA
MSSPTNRAAEIKPSIVYYLQFGDRIKIGTTINLQRRLGEIPHDRVLAIEPGGRALERQRHKEFAEERLTGEWFEPSQRLLAHIKKLRMAARASRNAA